ncbi:MAG: IclR family transcriptional regulator [Hyphomicrobiales bacterium]
MSSAATAEPKKGQRNEMRMIARAADVMRALAQGSGNMSLGQIAKATKLPRSTVQRLVGALEAEGFVATQAGQTGVRLGRELVRLGSAVHANLRSIIRPHLQELHARTKDTVDLSLIMDGVPIVVDQITSTASLRVVSFVGRPLPLHATASGKAHLMNMAREEAERLMAEPLRAFTSHTVTSAQQILKLAGTLPEGAFGYDREEFDEGVCAIALPIQTHGSDNYAIALSMPSKRFSDRLPVLREALRLAQRRIELALGVA